MILWTRSIPTTTPNLKGNYDVSSSNRPALGTAVLPGNRAGAPGSTPKAMRPGYVTRLATVAQLERHKGTQARRRMASLFWLTATAMVLIALASIAASQDIPQGHSEQVGALTVYGRGGAR